LNDKRSWNAIKSIKGQARENYRFVFVVGNFIPRNEIQFIHLWYWPRCF